MDAAGLERLAGLYSGSERVEVDKDGVGMVVVGDDPRDRCFGDEKGGLIADNQEQEGHTAHHERGGRFTALLFEVFHVSKRLSHILNYWSN